MRTSSRVRSVPVACVAAPLPPGWSFAWNGGIRLAAPIRAKRERARRCSTFSLVGGVRYGLAFEGLIDKLVSVLVQLAGDPGKLPCLEGLEGFLDFFVELGGSLVLVPRTRYLVDNVRRVAESGDIGESFLGGELETANQSLVLGFVGAAHGSHVLGETGQHGATIGFLENDSNGALRLALFVGSRASVDEQQVVALLEVIDHEEPLTWT